jgi:hypothetical protein
LVVDPGLFISEWAFGEGADALFLFAAVVTDELGRVLLATSNLAAYVNERDG